MWSKTWTFTGCFKTSEREREQLKKNDLRHEFGKWLSWQSILIHKRAINLYILVMTNTNGTDHERKLIRFFISRRFPCVNDIFFIQMMRCDKQHGDTWPMKGDFILKKKKLFEKKVSDRIVRRFFVTFHTEDLCEILKSLIVMRL